MSEISTSRAEDPRPARTRALLIDALFELVQEKRWERITVQDVLDKTGCGRSTFYAHFENKFDLLTSSVPSITVPIASTGAPMPDLMPLFEHVEEMLPVLRPLLTQPLVGEISDVFRRELADAWRQHLASRGIPEGRRDTPALFLAGAFLAVCIDWVERSCARPVQDLCAQYTALATAAVEWEVDYQAKL